MKFFEKNEYNLTLINIVKNSLVFLLLPAHYFMVYGTIDIYSLIIGLIGYLIAYHSIYFFNDIMDYQEDKKDELKKSIKPLVKGKITIETAISKMFIYSILGLTICFYINILFGILVLSTLFFNFLHSSNITRLKKTKLRNLNFFFIQTSKVSASWFTLSNTLVSFPFFLVFLFSSSYTLLFSYYKNLKTTNDFTFYKKSKLLSLLLSCFYILCLITYPYRLILIFLACFGLSIFFIYFYYISDSKINSPLAKLKLGTYLLSIFTLLTFIIAFLLYSNPVLATINTELNKTFEPISKNITETQEKVIVDFESNFYKFVNLSNSMYPDRTFFIKNFKITIS